MIQVKHLETKPQNCHMYFHQRSILMILALFHNICQVVIRQEIQVLCQVQYLHYYQA